MDIIKELNLALKSLDGIKGTQGAQERIARVVLALQEKGVTYRIQIKFLEYYKSEFRDYGIHDVVPPPVFHSYYKALDYLENNIKAFDRRFHLNEHKKLWEHRIVTVFQSENS